MELWPEPNRKPTFNYLSFVLDPLSANSLDRAMFNSTFVRLGTLWMCVLSNLSDYASDEKNSFRALMICQPHAMPKIN
jgi:hypothetical protein